MVHHTNHVKTRHLTEEGNSKPLHRCKDLSLTSITVEFLHHPLSHPILTSPRKQIEYNIPVKVTIYMKKN